MPMLSRTLAYLLFAATAASAIEKEFADKMVQSAQNLEKDALAVKQALKSKSFDAPEVTGKIDAMSADVAKLREIVKDYDDSNPALSQSDSAIWKLVKDKIHIIEVFHQQKKSMAETGLAKNRSSIRQFAEGVAIRAKKLQESALKLRRG